jgi:hypothetical protein
MPRATIYERPKDKQLWSRVRAIAKARHLSLSEIVAAALRLWLAEPGQTKGDASK